MAENTNITPQRPEQELDPARIQAAAFVGDTSIRSPLPDMKGRVNRHTSGYWALAIPALSVRYLAEAGAGIIENAKTGLASKTGLAKLAQIPTKTIQTAYAGIVGAFMMTVSSYYMKRTYNDLKAAFAESIAYETGKKPEDIKFGDIMNSNNSLVEAARKNFFKYNRRRAAVNLPFFANLVFKDTIDPRNAVLLGTATNSLYLMSDVLTRKETFFERLQSFVDEKLLHTEKLGEKIKAIDLINLYELHSRDKNPNYRFTGRMDTQEWQDRVKVFGRIAELMNETYGNQHNSEHANFSLSKMIYLMGHGMITTHADPERSLAYIEVANKYGIEAVKDMASKSMSDGSDLKYAKERYPTVVHDAGKTQEPTAETQPGFAAKFAQDSGMTKGDKVLTQRAAANDATRATTI